MWYDSAMKIVIATPLYPPEIAPPAPYTKELAKRLSLNHQVTIVAYANIPEEISGVHIVAIHKYQPLPIRLIRYSVALLRASFSADILYAENGASVELPLGIVSIILRSKIVLHIGDTHAEERLRRSHLLRLIRYFATLRSMTVITSTPKPRPEILPFEKGSPDAFEKYERSWEDHCTNLEKLFTHGT